jgi:hypothetical protein
VKLDGEGHAARGPGWEERREEGVSFRQRFELRAGQWMLLELARQVFGDATSVRLVRGARERPPFRGMVILRVPFRSMEDHRAREGVFLSLAAADPVVAAVPMLYVFEPDPALPGPPAPGVSAGGTPVSPSTSPSRP